MPHILYTFYNAVPASLKSYMWRELNSQWDLHCRKVILFTHRNICNIYRPYTYINRNILGTLFSKQCNVLKESGGFQVEGHEHDESSH